jgi:hypothetical protein
MLAPATLRSRRGLSLLEVAILLVIAVAFCFLLLPILGRSRENARARYCSSNLRRLYQAMDDFWETWETRRAIETLRSSRDFGEGGWPLYLQAYLEDDSFEPNETLSIPPRPLFLTCPSHPQAMDQTNPSKCLYVLILADDEGELDSPQRDFQWAFRDCARDLDAPRPNDLWSVGRVITREVADAEVKKRKGPHAHGVFQEWGAARQTAWDADRRDFQAERIVPGP